MSTQRLNLGLFLNMKKSIATEIYPFHLSVCYGYLWKALEMQLMLENVISEPNTVGSTVRIGNREL